MRILYSSLLLVVTVACLFHTSCKPSSNSKYFYEVDKDTIKPVLNITVPMKNDYSYHYGDDIHVVGTATDLQTVIKSGKLKSLYVNVSSIDKTNDAAIKTYISKYLDVDGKDGFTINEKMSIPVGSGITDMRFIGKVTDYAGKVDYDTTYFGIQ